MKTRVGILLAVAIALVTALALYARPGPETPPVAWMPSSIDETVTAGETAEIPVSFITSKDLTDVVVWVVPELAGLVSVTPESLGNVPAGSTVQLAVTIAPAATSEPLAVDGAIQLKRERKPSRTYAQPLPVTLKIVWPTASSALGFSISFPPYYEKTEVIAPGAQKVVFLPSAEAPVSAPGFFVHLDSLRGDTLRDHLHANGISDDGIEEVVIGQRTFLKAVEPLGDDMVMVSYNILFKGTEVISVSSGSPLFAESADFLSIVDSLAF